MDRDQANKDVWILKDSRDVHYVAVPVTKDRLYSAAVWCKGKIEVLKDQYDTRIPLLFFQSNGVRSYLRKGDWLVRNMNTNKFYSYPPDITMYNELERVSPLTAIPWFNT